MKAVLVMLYPHEDFHASSFSASSDSFGFNLSLCRIHSAAHHADNAHQNKLKTAVRRA